MADKTKKSLFEGYNLTPEEMSDQIKAMTVKTEVVAGRKFYLVPNVIDQDMETYSSSGQLLGYRPMTINEQLEFPRPNPRLSINEEGTLY